MRHKYFAPAILLLLIGNDSYAAGLSQGEIKARDFSYQSATFGMTLANFERKFEVDTPVADDATQQTVTHDIHDSNGRIVRIEFQHDQLSAISLILPPEEIDDVGGYPTAEQSIIDMFGRPDNDNDGYYCWFFPNVDRNVECIPARGGLTVRVSDTSKSQQ